MEIEGRLQVGYRFLRVGLVNYLGFQYYEEFFKQLRSFEYLCSLKEVRDFSGSQLDKFYKVIYRKSYNIVEYSKNRKKKIERILGFR